MPESSVRPRRIVVGVSGASGAALGLECLKCLRQPALSRRLSSRAGRDHHRAGARHDARRVCVLCRCGLRQQEHWRCHRKRHLFGRRHDRGSLLHEDARRHRERLQRKPVAACGRCADERAAPSGAYGARDALQCDSCRQHGTPARVPGVMLMPPMLTFYNGPVTLDEAVHHIAAKALEAVGVSCANYKRWS